MKKIIYTTLIAAIVGGAIYAYATYNKGHRDVAHTEAVAHLTGPDLFDLFDVQEEESMKRFGDQVIELVGTIYDIDLTNSSEPQIVIEGNGDNGFIRCGFDTEALQKVNSYKSGQTISIKGECKGINKTEGLDLLSDVDVVLSNCVILEK